MTIWISCGRASAFRHTDRDPIVEYKMAGYDMFDDMIAGIQEDTVRVMMHIRRAGSQERAGRKPMSTNKDDSAVNAPKSGQTTRSIRTIRALAVPEKYKHAAADSGIIKLAYLFAENSETKMPAGDNL